jgi:hypothetical protein
VQPLAVPFSLLLAVAMFDLPPAISEWWRKVLVGLTVVLLVGTIAAPFVAGAAVTRSRIEAMPDVARLVFFSFGSAPGVVAATNLWRVDSINPVIIGAGMMLAFCAALLPFSLRDRVRKSVHLAVWTGSIAAMAMVLYATAAMPWMRLKEEIRPFARRIDHAVPAGTTLYAYSLEDYAPLLATLFYLRALPVAYAPDADHAPDGRQLYLVRGKDDRKFRNRFRVEGEPVASWLPAGEKAPSEVVWAERTPR